MKPNNELKDILNDIQINLDNKLTKNRLRDNKDNLEKLKVVMDKYVANYELLEESLDNIDQKEQFLGKAKQLLSLTNDSIFNVHNFINLALYFISKEDVVKKKISSATEIIAMKKEKKEIDNFIEEIVDRLGIKISEFKDLSEIVKTDIKNNRADLEEYKILLSKTTSDASKEKDKYLYNLKKFEEKYEEMLNKEVGTRIGIEKAYQKIQSERIEEVQKYKSEIKQLEKETTNSIKNFEKSHKESINLKESKDYWNSKSKNHNSWSRVYFILFLVIVCLPIWVIFDFSNIDMQNLDLNNTKTIVSSVKIKNFSFNIDNILHLGLYILIISIWLWLARIILKISLSNRHLGEEAKEKKTMINTYLALTKEGNMDRENEKIILEAIFRPSANGIIKDDSAVTLLDLVKVMKK